ncbi:GAF domain-containing protein [Daejeonella rubra]|uniref:histidine kinase n=1 Tax=Daejeonella rubra TaxID=990371 RepID=A0A1G9UXM3_9SPHI|nr:GAF domain-containing sensor histidine kinase [Daejeonella rubra]SDM64610.1 GAF domain-containing protein [Daejeonella rubra]
MSINQPFPSNEFERVLNLSDFNLDYTNFQDNFKDLAKLAASVAGTPISLVNLIDSFTQWTISSHGFAIEQMPREDSVCQYTILSNEQPFEVEDLSKDDRFKDKVYVKDEPSLRYYYGIPLQSDGLNIGALCVLDRNVRTLSPEKEELLRIIADEIVNRLKAYKAIESLRNKVKEVEATQNKVVHDIRGPLGGIIGLTEIISEQGKENKLDEVLEFINLIHKSGKSILDLADEILSSEKRNSNIVKGNELELKGFKDNLEKLYIPQAKSKDILLEVKIDPKSEGIPFPKNKLLQISGNLISNAIKFTPPDGKVKVELALEVNDKEKILKIIVSDTGEGMSTEKIDTILKGTASTENGTEGEKGYGFGMQLVKHLVESLNGKLSIRSSQGEGTTFEVLLKQTLL